MNASVRASATVGARSLLETIDGPADLARLRAEQVEDLAEDGPSYHGTPHMALLSHVPGMTIFAPSSAENLGAMLDHALELDGPVAIRYPKGEAPCVTMGGVGTGLRARLVREGSDVCILGVGKLVGAAEEAARLLGIPDAHVPHGSADTLAFEMGLDGAGLAATALDTLGPHPAMGRS